MELNTLKDLLIEQLRDVYSAESQIIEALPTMAEAASHTELRNAFHKHLQETKVQLERLEQIGDTMGVKLGGHKCKAMEGIIKEGNDMAKEKGEEDVIDAGLIACAQRVEHYEIAAYGTARTYAKQLGEDEVYDILSTTLEEEKKTDVALTDLAVERINLDANRN